MLIAHLPAGYLVSRAVSRRWILFGLAGSVFPDVDLLYFYLVDHRRHTHHSYWTHIPIFWVAIGVTCELFALGWPARLFVGNALVHLALDTVQGGIAWAYPFTAERFVLVRVPAVHGFWLWNFVLHWTFLLELPIVLGAASLALAQARTRTGPPRS